MVGNRKRSDGPLEPESAARKRLSGEKLAFDPVQNGLVDQDMQDDIDMGHPPPRAGWPSVNDALSFHTGTQVVLRPWIDSDLDTYHRLLDDPALWQFMPETYPDPLTRDTAEGLLKLTSEGQHHFVRAVLWRHVPVGQVRFEYHRHGETELSYWIGRPYWGQGLATAAIATAMRLPQAQSGLIAKIHHANEASIRAITKAGFRASGEVPGKPGWRLFRHQVPE